MRLASSGLPLTWPVVPPFLEHQPEARAFQRRPINPAHGVHAPAGRPSQRVAHRRHHPPGGSDTPRRGLISGVVSTRPVPWPGRGGGLRDAGFGAGGGVAGMRRGVLCGSDVRAVRGVCRVVCGRGLHGHHRSGAPRGAHPAVSCSRRRKSMFREPIEHRVGPPDGRQPSRTESIEAREADCGGGGRRQRLFGAVASDRRAGAGGGQRRPGVRVHHGPDVAAEHIEHTGRHARITERAHLVGVSDSTEAGAAADARRATPAPRQRHRGRLYISYLGVFPPQRSVAERARETPITSFMGFPAAPPAVLHSVRPSTNL